MTVEEAVVLAESTDSSLPAVEFTKPVSSPLKELLAEHQPTPAPSKQHKKVSFDMQPFSSQPTTSYGQQQPYGQTQHTMQQMSGNVASGMERARDWLQNCIQNCSDNMRVYVQQYPPLAAFLFTLVVLSAVPVSVYVLFGLVTSAIFLTIAFIGFSLVEGFILLTSGGILLTVLGGIALFTTVGFSVIFAIWASYRGGSMLVSNVWQGSGQISGQLREAAQRVSSSMQQQTPGSSYTSGTSQPFSSGSPMGGPTSSS